jgi:hypothetical protein
MINIVKKNNYTIIWSNRCESYVADVSEDSSSAFFDVDNRHTETALTSHSPVSDDYIKMLTRNRCWFLLIRSSNIITLLYKKTQMAHETLRHGY